MKIAGFILYTAFALLIGAVFHKPILRTATWTLHCDKTICK